jgi:hypothetical protein
MIPVFERKKSVHTLERRPLWPAYIIYHVGSLDHLESNGNMMDEWLKKGEAAP